MSKILKSIAGRMLGYDPAGRLIVPNGARVGEDGVQMDAQAHNRIVEFNDFHDPMDASHTYGNMLFTEGTDSATSTASVLAGGIGGVLRLTTGDAGTGYAADAEQVTGRYLAWQALNGNLVFQTRVKFSAVTTMYAFFGFTDTVAAALEQPIKSASGTTFTTTASDACGFMFDTGMTSDNWWCTGVAADVDATHVDSGVAPTAAEYQTLRIEIDTEGTAKYYINGTQVARVTGAVTPGTDLTWVMAVSKLSVAASMTADIDYYRAEMDRGGFDAAY